jgi:hypothetical protein
MCETVNNAPGTWASINIVPNRYCQTTINREILEIPIDLVYHAIKQIDTAMDIADHV